MELYAFGYNGDGQITSANDDKNQVQSTCCEPTRISFEDVTKLKGVESELAAFPRPSVNRETGQFKKPSSSKSPDDQTERSSLGEKVFGSISWSNILFVADENLHIRGWNDDKTFQSYKVHYSQYQIVDITSGWMRTFFTTTDGQCYVWEGEDWKSNPQKIMNLVDDVALNFTRVDTGETHTIVTTDSGDVGTVEKSETGDFIYVPLVSKLNIKQVSCGKEHVLMLTRIGEVYSYGGGSRGQLGHGSTDATHDVRVIEALEGVAMVTVASGGWHSAAVSDTGDLYVWGWNESGQLGLPCRESQERNVEGYRCSKCDKPEYVNVLTLPIALDFDVCQECRKRGTEKLGTENTQGHVDTNQGCITLDSEGEVVVARIACGSRHSIMLSDSGVVYTWGWNGQGQLGHGDMLSRDRPTAIEFFNNNQNITPVDVNAGFWNSVVTVKYHKPDG